MGLGFFICKSQLVLLSLQYTKTNKRMDEVRSKNIADIEEAKIGEVGKNPHMIFESSFAQTAEKSRQKAIELIENDPETYATGYEKAIITKVTISRGYGAYEEKGYAVVLIEKD